MKTDTLRLLSVLRDAMGPPKTPAPDERSSSSPLVLRRRWRRMSDPPSSSVYRREHLLGREEKGREVEHLFAAAPRRLLFIHAAES